MFKIRWSNDFTEHLKKIANLKQPTSFNELKSLLNKREKSTKKPEFTLNLNTRSDNTYNALTDKHLSSYFESVRRRNHLMQMSLINDSGQVVEKPITGDCHEDLTFNYLKLSASERKSRFAIYNKLHRKPSICTNKIKSPIILPKIKSKPSTNRKSTPGIKECNNCRE